MWPCWGQCALVITNMLLQLGSDVSKTQTRSKVSLFLLLIDPHVALTATSPTLFALHPDENSISETVCKPQFNTFFYKICRSH